MLDKGRISSVQLMLLLFMAEMATVFLFVPGIVAREAGRDGWLSILIPVTLYGLLVALVCVALGRRYPRQVFTEYLPKILGMIPGKLLAAAYTLVFIHLTTVIVAEGVGFIHVAFLPETPFSVFTVVLASVAAYGVYLGIEVIARQNGLVFSVFVISVLFILALVANETRLINFRPFLEDGLIPILKGSMVPAAWRGEVFLILMLLPYLNRKEEALQTSLGTIIMSGVFAAAVFAGTIGVFGDLVASCLAYPVHSLISYISLADFLERIELLLVIIWIAGTIIKLAIFTHTCCIAAATTLGLNNYRHTIIPISIIIVIIATTVYHSHYRIVEFLTKFWPFYAYTIELIIPGLVLLIALLRKKRDDNEINAKLNKL